MGVTALTYFRDRFMTQKSDNIATGVLLGVIMLLFALMSAFTPHILDDYFFTNLYLEYSGNDSGFDFDGWLGYIGELRQNDNSRISNMLLPFATVIVPWKLIFPAVSAFLWTLCVWMVVRICGFNRRFVPTALLWFVLTFFLPWRNNLYVADYVLNYIFSAAVTLVALWLIMRSRRHLPAWLMLVSVPVIILAGGWHEGFAVPVLCGLGVVAAMRRFRMSGRWYTLCIIYTISTAAFGVSPGMISRFTREYSASAPTDLLKMNIDLALPYLTFFSAGIIVIVRPLRRRFADVLVNPWFVIFLTAAFVGTVISMCLEHTPRTAFWPTFCSASALFLLTKQWLESNAGRRWMLAAGIAASLSCCAVLVNALWWQVRIWHEFNDITELMKRDKVVYYDMTMPETVPVTTLYIPTRSTWVTPYVTRCYDQFNGSTGHNVVPTALRAADIHSDKLIGGNLQARLCGNALWMPLGPLTLHDENYFDVTLYDGTVIRKRPGFAARFKMADGDSALYIKPYNVDSRQVSSISLSD